MPGFPNIYDKYEYSHTDWLNMFFFSVLARTKTAESSFSYGNGADVTDTTHLIQSRKPASSVKASVHTVNLTYKPDEENDSEYYKTENSELCDCTDTRQNFLHMDESFQQVRKRPSYKRAISGGLSTPLIPNDKLQQNTPRERKSIFSGKNVKYQWYFVADVIDTTAFIVYVIVMFFGILTVLVILPLFA